MENWLPRYTGLPLEKFGKYILLTNFQNYVDRFAAWQNVEVVGKDKPMPCATDDEITIINFSMGSANAATIMDLLVAVKPKAVPTPTRARAASFLILNVTSFFIVLQN